ncbi:MAG TPA: hypothetical protein VL068_14265 [Microthrixaceae bacterium]|nr:hypothetical protein [Microthrixaceae bacterium]
MEDRRAVEGLEHLQAAANELVAAARSFLDVAEEAIADPDRFGGLAAGAVDILKGLTGKGEQPWERHAWHDPDGQAANDPTDDTAGVAVDVAGVAVDVTAEPAVDSDDVTVAESDVFGGPADDEAEREVEKISKPAARVKKTPAASRVKRIAVD